MNSEEQQEMVDQLADENPEALVMNGYEGCEIGIARRCGQPSLMAYSREKILERMMENGDLDEGDAEEFLEFNIAGAWCGEGTPLII